MLDSLNNTSVAIYDKSGKRTEKKIYSIRYLQNSEKSFTLELKIDGGVPLKHFVSGDDIFPNISELLTNRCKLEQFDFDSVIIH